VTKRLKIIDLFSGAGGLTSGFAREAAVTDHVTVTPVFANDVDPAAADSYNANFGDHCVVGDLVDLLDESLVPIPEADVVLGGPPCQGFSLLNRARRSDPRRALWRPFMQVVERSGASVFVIENVRQLMTSPELDEIRAAANGLGFEVSAAVLCSADFGVPQARYRAFVIGARDRSLATAFPPRPTHVSRRRLSQAEGSDGGVQQWVTVEDAIADLPDPVGRSIRDEGPPLNLHFGRNPTPKSLERYRVVPAGGNRFDLQRLAPELTPPCWVRKKTGGTDLFGRLWWDRPSVTIRTEFFKPEKGRYLHPTEDRPITHREAARLQSFSDDFVFCGSKIQIARQIGNAVPPALGEAVARSVFMLFDEESTTQC